MEHNEYGDEAASVIVDQDGRLRSEHGRRADRLVAVVAVDIMDPPGNTPYGPVNELQRQEDGIGVRATPRGEKLSPGPICRFPRKTKKTPSQDACPARGSMSYCGAIDGVIRLLLDIPWPLRRRSPATSRGVSNPITPGRDLWRSGRTDEQPAHGSGSPPTSCLAAHQPQCRFR